MKRQNLTKALSLIMAATMTLSLAACGSKDSSDGSGDGSGASGQTTISLYTTIPGKDAEFEALCEEFMEANPDIKVDYIAYDSSEKQKWMTLYSSGQAPTVSIMDAVDIIQNSENLLPLDSSELTFMNQIDQSYVDVYKGADGQVYGIPNSVQAMGILYNKTTIEEATGETFDPSTIKTRDDLIALCDKIQAGGVAPLMLTGVDWSLGSHFLSQVFTGIRGGADEQEAFIESVKAGEVDLKNDEAWNNVMDTFDVFAKYNYNSNDPLVGNTDIDGQTMTSGKAAMWFMGDWGWSYLESTADPEDEYGIMPVPLTNNADDAINQQLGVFPAKGYCIDASQSTEEQQAAAKKFVEFLCLGNQQAMADLLAVALPFADADVEYTSPVIASTQSYIQSGNTYSTYAFSLLLPSDFWSENGATMQQYLVGQCDRDTAADAIQAYWQAQS